MAPRTSRVLSSLVRTRQRFLINTNGLGGGVFPGEPRRLSEPSAAHFTAFRRVTAQPFKCIRPAGNIMGWQQMSGFSRYFGQAGRVGSEHGGAARHRFQDGQPEAFVARRVDEEGRTGVERRQICFVHPAGRTEDGYRFRSLLPSPGRLPITGRLFLAGSPPAPAETGCEGRSEAVRTP